MEKVAECVEKVPDLFAAYAKHDAEALAALSKRISKLEHEADLLKNDLRNSLPRGLFMPVDRANLLKILAMQDDIADHAENIAVLLTFKFAKSVPTFRAKFDAFVARNIDAFQKVREIIGELDELIESGFGGAEAEKVRQMVEGVALVEHEADVMQRDLLRELLTHEDEISYGDFFLWSRLIRQVSAISNRSENLANSVRMTLESK
jgi:predicted phosphate transport protein (TIGR00153 family)